MKTTIELRDDADEAVLRQFIITKGRKPRSVGEFARWVCKHTGRKELSREIAGRLPELLKKELT